MDGCFSARARARNRVHAGSGFVCVGALTELWHDADAAAAALGDQGLDVDLRVEAAERAREARSQVWVELALNAEAALVARVQVQHVELCGQHRVHEVEDGAHGEEAAARVEHQPAPCKGGRVRDGHGVVHERGRRGGARGPRDELREALERVNGALRRLTATVRAARAGAGGRGRASVTQVAPVARGLELT